VAFSSADTGKILAKLPFLVSDRDFLITCPADKVYPAGFFYTNKEENVAVFTKMNESGEWKEMGISDPNRTSYIRRLNLKNLIIIRLQNNGNYQSLADHFVQNKKILSQINSQNPPRMLKS
jgi:hypothetical protein